MLRPFEPAAVPSAVYHERRPLSMISTGRVLVRVLFVACMVLVLLGDYTGLLAKLLGVGRHLQQQQQHLGERENGRAPRASATVYGDMANIDLDAEIEDDTLRQLGNPRSRSQILATIKNACLPKFICELNATPQREKLTESEKFLLNLIKDTSISTTAELTSHYHFAAHMGQLIAGVDGNGCHNFYPSCPIPGMQVLQMMKKVRIR